MKAPGSTGEGHWKLGNLSAEEESGIPRVAVKCVEVRLPCYDLARIDNSGFGTSLLAVGLATSAVSVFPSLTGGVYKTRERIHRGMLIRDY